MSEEELHEITQGLSQSEVKKQGEKYGLNEVEEKEERWFLRLFRRFWGPIPWMIEAAAILSGAVKRWDDLVIILILFFVNAIVDFYQESKALNAIAVLKKRLARQAFVLRDGKWSKIPARELVPEDIVKVRIGDIVPADIKLLESDDFLSVDQSALTGESL